MQRTSGRATRPVEERQGRGRPAGAGAWTALAALGVGAVVARRLLAGRGARRTPAPAAEQALPGAGAERAERPARRPSPFIPAGLVERLLGRGGLAGPTRRAQRRQLLAFVLLTWAPLAILAAWEGHLLSGVTLPFLYDLSAHVRLLLVGPLLILLARPIGARLAEVAWNVKLEGLVDEERLRASVARAARRSEAIFPEVALLILALALTPLLSRTLAGSFATRWDAAAAAGALGGRSLAGVWLSAVSLPLFSFLLLRWLWWQLIWAAFLMGVAGRRPALVRNHPDGAGGLGFLAPGQELLALVFAVAYLAPAAQIGTATLYGGQPLRAFHTSVALLVAFALLMAYGPLLAFTPHLLRERWRARLAYSRAGARLGRAFERTWVRAAGERGAPDVDPSTICDYGTVHRTTAQLRPVPFGLDSPLRTAVLVALPFAPLLLIEVPLQELALRALRLVVG